MHALLPQLRIIVVSNVKYHFNDSVSLLRFFFHTFFTLLSYA